MQIPLTNPRPACLCSGRDVFRIMAYVQRVSMLEVFLHMVETCVLKLSALVIFIHTCPLLLHPGMCTRTIAPLSWPVTHRMTWTAGSRLSSVLGSILRRQLTLAHVHCSELWCSFAWSVFNFGSSVISDHVSLFIVFPFTALL